MKEHDILKEKTLSSFEKASFPEWERGEYAGCSRPSCNSSRESRGIHIQDTDTETGSVVYTSSNESGSTLIQDADSESGSVVP